MNRFRAFFLIIVAGWAGNLDAGSLDVTVKGNNGALVPDAVVYAQKDGATSGPAGKQEIIDQRDKQFVPYVTAVQVGTS
ncbi:MAG TPA: hypothetical protein VLK27_08535, partial [Chthoniobacterales bacterium]|nr:hypothetical protein [Chthoniobacterales bacterium]